MGERMWSGLAHAKPKVTGSVLEGAAGGYVNVVALSVDRADFLWRVSRAFDDLDLMITEIQDFVLLDEDDSHELGPVDIYLAAMIAATRFRLAA